jgi:AraC-like DNA-binding protein
MNVISTANSIPNKTAFWDGRCIVGKSAWLFSGTLLKTLQMQAPACQLVALRNPAPLQMADMTVPPAAFIPVKQLCGPGATPVEVNVLVLDPATHLASWLHSVSIQDLIVRIDFALINQATELAIVQRNFEPMVQALVHCLREVAAPFDASVPWLARGSQHPRVNRFMQALNEGLQINTVNEAAALANLSVRRFCEVFRSEFGLPCSEYLMLQKFLKMLTTLSNDNVSVTHAAHEAGFVDLSHFNRSCKRFMNVKSMDLYGMRVARSVD